MTCHNCQRIAKKYGKDRKGQQRFRCAACSKVFLEPREKPLNNMYLPIDKALACLRMMVEGNSVRSIERITGVNRNTILSLLTVAGERCERLLNEKLRDLQVRDVQADETFAFVKMKEKTKKKKGIDDDRIGDAYTFVALERYTKLVIAYHLGRRDASNTFAFTEKIYKATSGRFQLTTDGFAAYPDAIAHSLGTRVDYAQLIKVYGSPVDADHRYSPSEVKEIVVKPLWGRPDPQEICTSHVERQNLTMRMMMRRLTRLTNGFSKKFENLKAALALHFAYYNFCRIHTTIRCTPAMEAGITNHVWELSELLTA